MPLRILLVDDNVDTATNLSFLCESWGHKVRVAHDGPSAIEAALDFRPDALLLDIGLPSLDGFEVAERLRSLPEFARTFLIATTGYNHEKDRRRAREMGIDLYLVKPFDPWQLEGIFESCRPSSEAIPA
jgi:CheY-like chemotaxis protein